MIQTRTPNTILLVAIILCLLQSIVGAQGHSIFDRDIPTQQDVQAILELAKRLNGRNQLTAKEMLQIYYAEKKIGRCVWGISPRVSNLYDGRDLGMLGYVDSTVAAQCVLYVQTNRLRFRVVDDGWKGEENFWEPNEHWFERAKRAYPNSRETLEIEFDLEFSQFIRRFDIDLRAQGKTCDQYYKDELEKNGDVYRKVYSDDDIKQWVPECAKVRYDFQASRKRLLDKYRNAPFTKKLQNIDITTIVVFHSVC
jgi:hypothetical protein